MSARLKEGQMAEEQKDTTDVTDSIIFETENPGGETGGLKNTEMMQEEEKATGKPEKPEKTVEERCRYIFSDEVLLDGEDGSVLEEIRKRVNKELKPSGELESIIVDRIVSSVWRLKRCLAYESQILEYQYFVEEYEQGIFKTRKRTEKEKKQLGALKVKSKVEELSRYETLLERQIYKALGELDRLRRRGSRREKRLSRSV